MDGGCGMLFFCGVDIYSKKRDIGCQVDIDGTFIWSMYKHVNDFLIEFALKIEFFFLSHNRKRRQGLMYIYFV